MNDAEQPGSGQPDSDEAAFDDRSTDWVRDLLAEARVTGPVPDDVAARLDATLASLRDERLLEQQHGGAADPARDPEPAVVVPLRRRVAPLLAAAAVVVVIGGVAIGQIVRDGSDRSGSTVSADSAGGSSSGLAAQPGVPPTSAPEQAPSALTGAAQALPELTAASFPQDVARVMRDLSGPESSATGSSPSAGGTTDDLDQMSTPKAAKTAPPVTAAPERSAASAGAPSSDCPGPGATGAVTLPAMLDGTLVALVFRPPTAASQQVEAWSCDGRTLLASASVPH